MVLIVHRCGISLLRSYPAFKIWEGTFMSNDKTSIFLVAGNRLLREALARLLTRKGFNVCGVSAWIPDSSSAVVAAAAEVLVLDSVTARLSDCSFISNMVSQLPNSKVVLIDMDSD